MASVFATGETSAYPHIWNSGVAEYRAAKERTASEPLRTTVARHRAGSGRVA